MDARPLPRPGLAMCGLHLGPRLCLMRLSHSLLTCPPGDTPCHNRTPYHVHSTSWF